jgi:predicted MFS family arabinose efflux permease
VPRRPLIVFAALGMGVLLVPLLNLTPSVWFTLVLFCAMALFASLRSTTASTLGLDQLPGQPGAMMGARTASAQLGYMIGAAAGGAVLALADFGALGVVLFAGMALSAVLIARVSDPQPARR